MVNLGLMPRCLRARQPCPCRAVGLRAYQPYRRLSVERDRQTPRAVQAAANHGISQLPLAYAQKDILR